jgi:Tfp pilus assembly protein PilP
MKLTTGIVVLALSAGTLSAQNPANVIQTTKNSLQAVQQQKTAASNAALQGSGTPAKPSPATASTKPAPTSPAPAPAKPAPSQQASVKPAVVQAVSAPSVKPASAKAAPTKIVPAKVAATAPVKPVVVASPTPKVAAKPTVPASKPAAAASATAPTPTPSKPEEKKYSMTGKRDPFISPVVNRQGGSGCSTGKKCLDIEQIAVRGVVKSDNGMIAVVTNGLNKAYFLRENDPVFNGYVVKITVDSVVFKQNFQDRLGKPFTKDVVKRLTTPAV